MSEARGKSPPDFSRSARPGDGVEFWHDRLKGKRRLKPEDQAKFEELKGYVESLAKGQAGVYECDPGEDPRKVRNLLRRVAAASNNLLRIQLEGSRVIFIPRAEATVVRRRKGAEEGQG